MEHQEGDELLLSRAWRTGGDAPVGENTEPSEQLDSQGGRNSHVQDYMRLRNATARQTFPPSSAGAAHERQLLSG